jgi:long-chain acyl-CoA synthetase
MLFKKIQELAIENPNKQAIVYKGKAINYAELLQIIEFRGDSFRDLAEKNILLCHKNELENLLTFLAALSIGKASVFASRHLSDAQITALAVSHNAVIFDEKFDLEVKNLNQEPIEIVNEGKSNAIFLGVLTSGTTGVPNLIWKDYQSWFSAFPHQSQIFGINQSDRLFVLDALAYSANLNSALHMLWAGGTVVLTSLSTANTWVQQIENEHVTSIFMVPSHLKLISHAKLLSNLKSIVSAGEKLNPDTAQKLIDIAPNSLLTEYYGAAELGHITYHQGLEIVENPISVGRAFPEVKIEIKGEQLFVESPYISPDFRNKKATFDLGYFVDDKLILMGRAGRMFNRRGLNVFAEEIEHFVKTIPYIIDAVAIGVLQTGGSHDIFVVYTCTNGFQNNANSDAIMAYLSSQLEPTKRPNKLVEFEDLPRTNFGKIDYNALARSFEAEAIA